MPGWQKTRAERERHNRNYDARWKRARLACLKAANWRCQIRLDGICIGAASQVDHIDQVENDPGHRNLRAACDPCHKRVTAQQGGGYRNKPADDPAPRPRTAW